MRMLIAIALVLCACSDENETLPVITGGGGGPPQSGSAVFGGNPGVVLITGRVCLLSDPRFLAVCSPTAAGGLIVQLGSSSTVTGATGSFSMPAPTGTNLLFSVSGPSIVTSSQPITATNVIPVLTQDMFGQVLAANSIALAPNSGSILASVTDRSGNPMAGVTATSMPAGSAGPFFDGTTPTGFTQDETGVRGIALFPGVTAGPASVTFSDLGRETTVDGVQVFDGGITLLDTVLP